MTKTDQQDFQKTFSTLKKIFKPYEQNLKVTSDKSGFYNLDAGFSEKYKKVIYFGGVHIKKNYISFYLMPVYINRKLLSGISPQLKKRMQGKSCFNFKTIDNDLITELTHLTEKGFEFYKQEGLV